VRSEHICPASGEFRRELFDPSWFHEDEDRTAACVNTRTERSCVIHAEETSDTEPETSEVKHLGVDFGEVESASRHSPDNQKVDQTKNSRLYLTQQCLEHCRPRTVAVNADHHD